MKELGYALALMITCFGCEEDPDPPEIWSDIPVVYVGARSIAPEIGAFEFNIRLGNAGDEMLIIESLTVKGDQNCSFVFEGPSNLKIGPTTASYVKGEYKPTVAGEDHVAIIITSNSVKNGVATIPVCGIGVNPGAEEPDAISCNVPPPDQPDCAAAQ
jgi:hypothetical protein